MNIDKRTNCLEDVINWAREMAQRLRELVLSEDTGLDLCTM